MNDKPLVRAGPTSRLKHFLYRALIQVVRLVLIALFLYITYLGFVWRKLPQPNGPRPTPAQQAPAPERPSASSR